MMNIIEYKITYILKLKEKKKRPLFMISRSTYRSEVTVTSNI